MELRDVFLQKRSHVDFYALLGHFFRHRVLVESIKIVTMACVELLVRYKPSVSGQTKQSIDHEG